MAQWSLNQYLATVVKSLQQYDGDVAAELLSFTHAHIANGRLQLENPENAVQKVMSSPWDEIVALHLRTLEETSDRLKNSLDLDLTKANGVSGLQIRGSIQSAECCWAVGNHDFVEAYSCQSALVQAFTKVFQSQKDENWSLPILFVLCLDLRLFANSGDLQAVRKGRGKLGDRLEKAAEILMGCFRVCASDNRASIEDTKKWGMLNLVNQLFKIYFKINKLHLCKPLIRAIDSLPMKDKFSLSHLITFRYYVGQKAMFDGDFRKAEEYLTFAFERCHQRSVKNKRLILIYLLPVKMLLGQMPSLWLLRKYNLMAFTDVVEGVRSGNMKLLNEALERNEGFFIKCGIYLILEKLKISAYRNLFKKVYLIQGTHQLPIQSFTTALQWMGQSDADNDETACILANLICDNKIKGYISHQHQKVVVSKQNPFPQLTTVL